MEVWGQDHWSTLLYLETRFVDHGGKIKIEQMRCNRARHPEYAHRASYTSYPTRLKGGAELPHHDDWDCAADLEAAGLIVVSLDNEDVPRVDFTEKGHALASAARWHRGKGGGINNFEPK